MSSHSRSAAVLPRVFCLVGPDDDLSLLPALAARGVTGFQVRDKTNEDRDCLALVVTVMASLTSYDVMVVVDDRLDVARSTAVTPLMFEHQLTDDAVRDRRHIVLPEGEEPRILQAADLVLRRGIADLTLLGDPVRISAAAASAGADVTGARIVDPSASDLTERLASELLERRRHKGMTAEEARTTVQDVSYFGTLMVELGLADGMVSGAVHTTAHTIRPALQVVRTVPGVSVVSSVFFMCLEHQVLVYGDCAVNPDPDPEQLADIAIPAVQAQRGGVAQ